MNSNLSRKVLKSIASIEKPEGMGARVRRSIGTELLPNFSPFLMLDHFKVPLGAGFPDHPHRGMTTLTFMLSGAFDHEDFTGRKGRIEAGDVQFMIAGKGIMHAEMPHFTDGGELPTGLQLWIDLPKAHKMTNPSYQELKSSDIPTAHPSPHVSITVICGQAQGQDGINLSSPIKPLGGCWFLSVAISKASTSVFQAIPKGWNAFIYTLSGEISIGGTKIAPFFTSVLTSAEGENGVEITSISEEARFVVVAGEPLDQEIVQYGPMVMTTEKEIRAAFFDYQHGINGFEGAHGWKSEIGRAGL